jgi:putative tricarboxylic transport membrane protein
VHKENTIAGLISVIAGLSVYWASEGFGIRGLAPDPLGPSVYPKMLGAGLVILGVILILMAVRSKDDQKKKDTLFSGASLRILSLIIAGALYIVLFERLGFILSTILFIFAIMNITGESRWQKSVTVSVIIPLCLYIIFNKLLNVLLPLGFGL